MLINKCHLKTQYKESTNFIIEVAKYDSKITFEDIKKWLDENSIIIENKDIENYLNKTFVNITLGDEEDGK